MEIMLIVVAPFLLAIAALVARSYLPSARQGWLLAAGLAALFVLGLGQLGSVTAQGAVTFSATWVAALDLNLSFYLDGLALLFVLVVTGLGTAVTFYGGYYFEDAQESGHFFALMMAFTGAMLALVTAGNVLTLFISWELTSIISFLLIGFYGDVKARGGALQALIVTGGGGLALLVGLLLIGTAAGTMEISAILSSGDVLREHPWYTAIVILVCVGSFSKSAQWPLHFWLPEAMTAPTPASAFLHSATMVKAGVYLLARLYPVLGDAALWESVLVTFGLITMLIGAFLALRQQDLKGSLAFSTISQLGALVALLGLPHSEGIKAAMVGILGHALYKGALFLVVGAVDHATGTRDLSQLGGLRTRMQGFAVVTALAGLSMAGIPPLLGFVAKELLIESSLHAASTLAVGVVVISAALTVAMALILFWDVFMRPAVHDDHGHFHALPSPMVYGPAGLAGLSLLLGLLVGPLVTPIITPTVGEPVKLYLFAPEIITSPLLLSGLAIAGGIAIFLTRNIWRTWAFPALPSGGQIYQSLVRGVEVVADLALKTQAGKIRYYLVIILAVVIGLMSTAGLSTLVNLSAINVQFRSAADVLKIMLLLLALGTMLASILFKQHLLAALALGVSGYSIGGVFLLEPAPDVALVQFLVETLGTVLIILILARTSAPERLKAIQNLWGGTRAGLWRDIAISTLVGVGITLFALAAVNSRPTRDTVATWHLQNALPQTGASDVVAAIVTDFRGMDTLIEITVFGMAALGVLTLLTLPTRGKPIELASRFRPLRRLLLRRGAAINEKANEVQVEIEEDEEVYTFKFSDPLTRMAARLVLPFALLIALGHILYGGGAPGDGFTAGVIGGLGVAVWYIVFGYADAKRRLHWIHPARLIGFGLALSLINAVLPLLFGRDFLAVTLLKDVALPAGLKFSSTVVFEVAICLTVLGGVSAVMEAISHPKEVERL
ncbi:MAG: DUF4040 domain-containing protein [Anaerolineae bacterium]|nr:DUF4040 domain-containing protein [Anaerolineae bacterium]